MGIVAERVRQVRQNITSTRRRDVLRWVDPHPEKLKDNTTRVFVTGHMVDDKRMGRQPTPRFPDTAEAIETAKTRIGEKLDFIYEKVLGEGKPFEVVLCSGSAGTDLLALEWVLAKNTTLREEGKPEIGIRAFLPYAKDSFVEHSVAYGENSGKWSNTFSQLDVVEPQFRRRGHRAIYEGATLTKALVDEAMRIAGKKKNQAYVELNNRMLGFLRKQDYVLALWDGKLPNGPGGTYDSLLKAGKVVAEDHVLFVDTDGILQNAKPGERSMNDVAQLRRSERWHPRKLFSIGPIH